MVGTIAWTLLGCIEKADDPGTDGGGVPQAVQQRFELYCSTSVACHAAGGYAPTLSTPASDAILSGISGQGGIPFVEIGNIDNSYLAQKILGTNIGATQKMPVGNPAIEGRVLSDDMAVIIGWIGGYMDFPDSELSTSTGVADSLESSEPGSSSTAMTEEGETEEQSTTDSGGAEDSTSEGEDPTTAPNEVTLEDVQPIFTASCTEPAGSCHGGTFPPDLREGETYDEVVNRTASGDIFGGRPYVAPRNLDRSYLWQKLDGEPGEDFTLDPMPPPNSDSELTRTELDLIAEWILDGANR